MELDLFERGQHRFQPGMIDRGTLHVEHTREPGLGQGRFPVALRPVRVGAVLVHHTLPSNHVLLERHERQHLRMTQKIVDLFRDEHPDTRCPPQPGQQKHLRRPHPTQRQPIEHLRTHSAQPLQITMRFRVTIRPPELCPTKPGQITMPVRDMQPAALHLTQQHQMLRQGSTPTHLQLGTPRQHLRIRQHAPGNDRIIDSHRHAHAPSRDTTPQGNIDQQ
ncbi:MAG: hypothetical protein WEB78_13185 [Ilumatobacteraceae bacterium]